MEMNFEGATKNEASNIEATYESRKTEGYHTAVTRYNELVNAVPEAEKLVFNERPPRDEKEKLVAKLDLQIDACLGQAEAFAQQGNPYAERAMRMLGQFKEAEKTIISLYFDALETSPEFAEVLRSEHPWLGDTTESSDKELPEVEYVQ